MINNSLSPKLRRQIIAIAAALGISAGVGGGAYIAFDSVEGAYSVENAQAWKQDGATAVIQALTAWSPCRLPPQLVTSRIRSLESAQAAGLGVAGYFLVSPHETGREAVDRVYASMPPEVWEAMAFVAVDFEVPSDCWPAFAIPYATIVSALDRLEELGKPRVVYTSCNEWHNHMNPSNPPKPPDTLLWNAAWDNDPDIDFTRCPFGGWTKDEIIMEQFSGGVIRGGVWVDQNVLIIPGGLTSGATPTPTATPQPGQPVAPPDYAPECWTDALDLRWDGRYNVCADAWVGPQGQFYNLKSGTWHYANGVMIR